MANNCPFKIGDKVKFAPSERTQGLYQNIEGMGVSIGEVIIIGQIKDNCYLFTENGKGGWPWNEWEAVK
jgi:hypothetical protein